MKIGILTFHRAHNYGAVLQAYALKEFLRSLGHESYVIDYNNKKLWDCYNWFQISDLQYCFCSLKNIPKRLLKLFYKWLFAIPRFYKFNKFQEKRLHLYPLENISRDKFDLILIGSDQVWNTKITNGFDEYYWGSFSRSKSIKVASYAASLKSKWAPFELPQVSILLSKLDAISVREAHTIEWITELNPQLNPILVPDPVFLLSQEQWQKIAVKPTKKTHYILFYQAMDSELVYTIAKNFANENKKDLVVLSANVNGRNSLCAHSSSPYEFLGWIKYADTIITSSLHATLFSIIFKKEFYCVDMQVGEDNRVRDVLESFGLQNRFIHSANEITRQETFDPSHTIEKLKNIAVNYVSNI